MAAAAAATEAQRRDAGSSDSDESDDDAAEASTAWNGDSADESDSQADSADRRNHASRRKRYKRIISAGQKEAEGFSAKSSQLTPIRRRILRKDRRPTLEMLTSDDDVNAYQATRPSSYLEPAARRNLHETAPHLKSSFETLYNPEFNHLQVAPALLSSSSSESLASETVEALTADTWQLASGPKVASPYLDVSLSRRPAVNARMTPEESDRREEHGQEDGRMFKHHSGATSGELWTEFGGPSPAAVDGDWTAHAQVARMSQPLSLSLRVSQPSLQLSSGAPTRSNGSVGVNVEIEMSRSAGVAEFPGTEKIAVQFEEPEQASKFPVKPPLLPDKPTAASVRGRRVLPAVPDSADLEVSDLLRGDAGVAPGSTDLANRPKSAVEILVPKGRCSSIQQLQSGTVSQQLRSLFHNPSPHIMLHRAATQQTQPQPPQSSRAESGGGDELGKASQKYMPLRASHGAQQQQRLQQSNLTDRSGRQSAVQMLMPMKQSTSRSLMSRPQQPPELPQRRNQGSSPPSQRIHQEAPHPSVPSQTDSLIMPQQSLNPQVPHDAFTPQIHSQPHRASPYAYSHQPPTSPSPAVPREPSHLQPSRQTAVHALFHASPPQSRATPVDPRHTSYYAASRTVNHSPLQAAPYKSNQSPAQAPPIPPRRARRTAHERQPLNMQNSSQPQPTVKQLNRRVLQAPDKHQLVAPYQQEVSLPDVISSSGEDDSGCCHLSGEYLLAKETTAAAAGSQTRIQTNPRTGRAVAPPEQERNQPPRGAHLPPNAVRVLPRLNSVEVGELRRLLVARRERAAEPARGGKPTEDAIAGLERMCRDMRLHDDQLLDGAERRDTAIRVQARLEVLRDSQNWPSNSAQRSDASTLEREISDQWHRLQVGSNSQGRQRSAMGTSVSAMAAAARSDAYLRMLRTDSQQRQQQQSQVLLQPGEQESGPEVIL